MVENSARPRWRFSKVPRTHAATVQEEEPQGTGRETAGTARAFPPMHQLSDRYTLSWFSFAHASNSACTVETIHFENPQTFWTR
jgi:hypothetical protein